MHSFYFFSKQFISCLKISVKFVPLIGDALLNHLKLVVVDFKVLVVLFIRNHHILKRVHHTYGYVVPFVWIQDPQLVLQSTQLCLILEALLLIPMKLLSDSECLLPQDSSTYIRVVILICIQHTARPRVKHLMLRLCIHVGLLNSCIVFFFALSISFHHFMNKFVTFIINIDTIRAFVPFKFEFKKWKISTMSRHGL